MGADASTRRTWTRDPRRRAHTDTRKDARARMGFEGRRGTEFVLPTLLRDNPNGAMVTIPGADASLRKTLLNSTLHGRTTT